MFHPRPKQEEVLAYQAGKMGVSAVPGSGKTATLSYLAARLVAQSALDDDQEILIVTLVRSAVGNFAQAMRRYLEGEFGLLPGFGYRVRTLHGLANDIVRERPGVVGLAEDFLVLDERDAETILEDAATDWSRIHADAPDPYLSAEKFDDAYTRNQQWPNLVKSLAGNFIKSAKDRRLTAVDLRQRLERGPADAHMLPLAAMCIDIYAQYEYALRYRGAVDFQDLIRLALDILETSDDYLARLQHRWPVILEDEAQDSSKLQEDILRKLAGPRGNWVRVGDPNQAIYETFTTANPRYLRQFLEEEGVMARELPNSGRSTRSIIALANALIDWSLQHPNPDLRERQPLSLPHIQPTPPGDPQGNPPDEPQQIHLLGRPFTPDQERNAIVESLKRWLPENEDKTVAILLPINRSGAEMVKQVRAAGLPYVENLRSTTSTRAVIGALTLALETLREPRDAGALSQAFRVWRRDERSDEDQQRLTSAIAAELRKLRYVEDYLWPRRIDWLAEQAPFEADTGAYDLLVQFRTVIQRWQGAADLPIDQLILTLAADLFTLESEIATAYSASIFLRRYADLHPLAGLAEYADELRAIARGQRNFSAIDEDDEAFDPDRHKGKVTITTMHKAKGLEWDRVYLMSVSNYDYPSADPFDSFISERWFIRDALNLEAEALAQLDTLEKGTPYIEGEATRAARLDYAAERLRLLYVGITRARRELVITWNTGRNGDNVEARPLAALRGWWEQQQKGEKP